MYSIDRLEPLEYTISCLRDMPLYDFCQKTLVVDGKIDKTPKDWEVLQVPRLDGKFCWGRMWDAGVFSAKNEKILYLDSDRLLPKNFLQLINEKLQDDLFIFTSMHFNMQNILSIEDCKKLLSFKSVDEMIVAASSIGFLRLETRHKEPYHGPGKNVMSGSTAFTKATYKRLGGVDQWYCGHGAFADNDFHMQASLGGCKFLDLGLPELHFPHRKNGENNNPLENNQLYKLGLDNFIYYCHKWKLPSILMDSYAAKTGINRPSEYVEKRKKELLR